MPPKDTTIVDGPTLWKVLSEKWLQSGISPALSTLHPVLQYNTPSMDMAKVIQDIGVRNHDPLCRDLLLIPNGRIHGDL